MPATSEPTVVYDRLLQEVERIERDSLDRVRYNSHPLRANAEEAVASVMEGLAIEEPSDLVDLIKMLGRSSHGALAMAVYRKFVQRRDHPYPDMRVYDATVTANCINMRHKECVEVLLDMSRWKVAGSTYTYNMIIQACGQRGDLTNALRAYNGMREAGVEPNTFTFAAILSACNYRGRPHLVEALRLWSEMKAHGRVEEELSEVLVGVVASALRHAEDSKTLCDSFTKIEEACCLEDIPLSQQQTVFEAAVGRLAELRDFACATAFFTRGMERGIPASTRLYNGFIRSALRSGQIQTALDLFEWMVEGRGNGGDPLVADTETYELLLQACHRRGLLEKALEILAWMEGAGVKASDRCLEELFMTSDIALLWDAKALELATEQYRPAAQDDPAASAGAVPAGESGALTRGGASRPLASLPTLCHPDYLRPSPYDGMRHIYLDDAVGRTEEAMLAARKLGIPGWAPPEMRPAAPPEASARGQPGGDFAARARSAAEAPAPHPGTSAASSPRAQRSAESVASPRGASAPRTRPKSVAGASGRASPTMGMRELKPVREALRRAVVGPSRSVPAVTQQELSASFNAEGHHGARPLLDGAKLTRQQMRSWLPSLNRFLEEAASPRKSPGAPGRSRWMEADMDLPDLPLSSRLTLTGGGKPRFTLATITRGGSKLPGTLSRTAPSGSLAGDLSAGQLHSAAATLLD